MPTQKHSRLNPTAKLNEYKREPSLLKADPASNFCLAPRTPLSVTNKANASTPEPTPAANIGGSMRPNTLLQNTESLNSFRRTKQPPHNKSKEPLDNTIYRPCLCCIFLTL